MIKGRESEFKYILALPSNLRLTRATLIAFVLAYAYPQRDTSSYSQHNYIENNIYNKKTKNWLNCCRYWFLFVFGFFYHLHRVLSL